MIMNLYKMKLHKCCSQMLDKTDFSSPKAHPLQGKKFS